MCDTCGCARESAFKGDKRVFERLDLKGVKVDFKDLRRGIEGSGVCLDIGGGGVTIESFEAVRPKTPLEMRFNLADGLGPLQLLGNVSWSKFEGASWRMGVSFDGARLMSMAPLLKISAQADKTE